MAIRIVGVDLPQNKRGEIALTYIYGIGRKTATDICKATGVDPDIRVRDLSEDDAAKLREYIDHNCRVEGDLRRDGHGSAGGDSLLPERLYREGRRSAEARARNAPGGNLRSARV